MTQHEEITVDNTAGGNAQLQEAFAAIDGIAEEFAPKMAAELAAEETGTDVPNEGTPVPNEGIEQAEQAVAPDGTPAPDQAAPPAEPEQERGIERLVQREVEVRAREEALKQRESHYVQVESENAQLRQTLQAVPDLSALATKPGAFLRALGHDPDQVVRLYMAEKMVASGQPVDPALAAAIQRAQEKSDYDARYRELEQRQRAHEAKVYYDEVDRGAHQYVNSGDISKHAPTLAGVAKADPARAHREIMDEIERDAAARAGRDPNGGVLSYEDAARAVEKRWADYQRLLVPPGPPPAASTTATAKPAPKAATPGASAPTPTAPAPLGARKAPASFDDLMKQGIAEGAAEFERSKQRARPQP